MAISFVGAGTPNSSTGTSINLAYPAGILAGDIMLICSASSGLTSPGASGFATVGAEIEGTSANLQVLWKRAVGGESGTIAVAQSGANVKLIVMLVYRGVVATDPPYEATQPANGASDTTACPDVTTLGANRIVVMVTSKDATQATPTTPAPWSERVNVNTATGSDQTLHIFDILASAAGLVAGPDVSYPADTDEWIALGFALIPAAGGTSINAAKQDLALTELAAVLGIDKNVLATRQQLTMTQRAAIKKVSRNVVATMQALNLVERTATVQLGSDVSINATRQVIDLIERTATKKLTRNVIAAAQSLALTEFPATVQLSTFDVRVLLTLLRNEENPLLRM